MNQTFIDILKRGNFVVLDTETTGLNKPAEVVEIAVIDPDGLALVDMLVHPKFGIPNEAYEITGISNMMVESAPTWPEVRPKVLEAIRGKDVIVYNAVYDRKILHWSDENWDNETTESTC